MSTRGRISESSSSTSVLLLAATVLVLIFAKVVLIPLAFALALSFVLAPGVARMQKAGLRRSVAVAIASALTLVCVVAGGTVLSRQILHVAQTLPSYRANIESRILSLESSSSENTLQDTVTLFQDLGRDLSPATSPSDAMRVQVVNQQPDRLEPALKLVASILEPAGQLAIVFIFAIYMLMNREDLRHRMLLLAGMGNINMMTVALEDAAARISQYLVMQLQVNACYGLVFGVGLYFLHVPEAALWGTIAGTLRLVPYVGTAMGTLPPLILSIAISPNWWNPLLVFALFLVIETVVAYLIEPLLFSHRTGISSLALLSSAIFWSMLWGWPGLVLSTPLTVCVVVLGQHVPQLAFLHSLLGNNATLSPAARVYERLLAMDQTEATAVAEKYLDGKPLEDLYDAVLLPVLGLAEEDKHKGALNDIRWKFLLLSVGDLIARYSEYHPKDAPEPHHHRHPQKAFAVVCLSAGGEGPELATAMLGQTLEREGYPVMTLAADSVPDDIFGALAASKDTVVILSALPPFAFAQTRALCQRVRAHMPHNRIAIAIWNSTEDSEEMLARFGTAHPEAVVGTLKQAIHQVDHWRRTPHNN